jgi:general secretion pathway protein I
MRRFPPRALRRHHGFSLLEVLVAFVVLALVAGALFQLFGGALRNAGAADDWSRALLVAESRLEEAASAQPLQAASAAGTEDGGQIEWHTSVEPYIPTDTDPELEHASDVMPTQLYRVRVEVTFPGNARSRSVSLATVKLGARNPP